MIKRCKVEASKHDEARGKLRECQRDLDAKGGEAVGASNALQQQLERERAEHQATRSQLATVEHNLERRPRWRRVVVWIAVAVISGYAAGRVHQWGRDRAREREVERPPGES